jgi:hypothetical protein
VSGQAPHACPAVLKIPLFGRTSGFLVGPDRGAVEERHPQLDPIALLRKRSRAGTPVLTLSGIDGSRIVDLPDPRHQGMQFVPLGSP